MDYVLINSQRNSVDILKTLQQWRKDGNLTDFRIICEDGKSLPVHKSVVAVRSEYLRAAASGSFKEGEENAMRLQAKSKVNKWLVLILTLKTIMSLFFQIC